MVGNRGHERFTGPKRLCEFVAVFGPQPENRQEAVTYYLLDFPLVATHQRNKISHERCDGVDDTFRTDRVD